MSLRSAEVPVIDISLLNGGDISAKREVARQIDAACRGSGFFYAAKHGIDLAKLSQVTKDFHRTITDEEKWRLAIRAYNPAHQKQIRNGYYMPVKEKKAVESFCFLNPNFKPTHPMIESGAPLHEVNVWPDCEKHAGFREFQESYFFAVFDVAQLLLKGFALALGKGEDFFAQYFKKENTLSAVSLIRYPFLDPYPPAAIKTAEDGTKLSFGWHFDVSLITVLYQSQVENLQVETPEGWQDISSNDEFYLVNTGTYMEHITKGYYTAPKHRVKWVNAERQSLPFFVNLGWDDAIPPFHPLEKEDDKQVEELPYGKYLAGGLQELINKNGQT